MRVLYLTDRVSVRGGADQHLLQVIGWAAARFEVTVAAARFEAGTELPASVRTERLRCLGSRSARAGGLAALSALVERADLVHLQNVMDPGALAAATASGRAVVTVQDHRVFCPGPGRTLPDGRACEREPSEEACSGCLPEPGYRARMLALARARRQALAAARLVVLSGYMARELEASGLPGAEVSPPWVEVSTGRAEPGEGFVLAGRLVRHKGVLTGLEAFRRAEVASPLRVAGAGPAEAELVGASRLGWLGAAELRALLRRSRALLFPARWQEPFGIVGLEALAEATPVVLFETGGTAEWSGRGCVRLAPGDLDGMAEAIGRLEADPARAARLGAEGRAAVRERFGRERVEARLAELYGAG